MTTNSRFAPLLTLALPICAALTMSTGSAAAPARPQGPCDIYAAAGTPCVAAHSSTRALYAAYQGPLYQVLRQSDGRTLDIGVVPPSAQPVPDAGGYANSAAQDAFCANTYCWISILYDQSPKRNHLIQAPRGGFSGPAMGGFNNLPIADMAPVTLMGHKVYGVFIAPGMGLRLNDAKGTAVDDQAEGQYWVINGHHYNSGCCFDYGNAETDSRDDGNGTMETTYYGNATAWYRGSGSGPWIMTDQENNLVGCVNPDGSKLCTNLPSITWRFVTAIAKGEPHHWTSLGGDAQRGPLSVMFDGPRIDVTYDPMRKQGAILLGNGGDNSVGSQGTFYEGAMTAAGTFPSDATDQLVQANVVAARYDVPRLSLAPASAAMPPGLQTFSPGSTTDVTLTFTNTTGSTVSGLKLSIDTPKQWTSAVSSSTTSSAAIPEAVAPGASVKATFKIISGPAPYNGDLVGRASWSAAGAPSTETTVQKVRNVSPVRINEFRVSAGNPPNSTNSFVEFHNAGTGPVDLSNWSFTQHPTQQPVLLRCPDTRRHKTRPRRLLPVGARHLRSRRAGAARRHHAVRQKHHRHFGGRHDRDRHRRRDGNPQGRWHRDGGRREHHTVAASARRHGDYDSRRLHECAGHQHGRVRGRPEGRARPWRHLPHHRKSAGEIRSGHGHGRRQARHAGIPGRRRTRRRH
ncbi:MAG: arabinofuranosidase catalytic domain-containing protein [Paludibaculum sp.]